ncbi:MAG: type III-B CRISPR module RAMP protein Cmr6 [Streptomycetales bacterium]
MPPGDGRPRPTMVAAGPLRRVLDSDGSAVKGRVGYQLGPDASALILLRRVAFFDEGNGELARSGMRALLRWAAESSLGQGRDQAVDLLAHAAARRTAALRALQGRGHQVVRLRVRPEWRLLVGAGSDDNPHEIELALHGTYGWPVIPGTGLKGLTAAWAAGSTRAGPPKAKDATLDQIFGTPRPGRPLREGDEARRGDVRFLDALPAGEPLRVTVDVLTPHHQPYYQGDPPGAPPAEYHNPVPHEFLVVSGGEFAVDLAGPGADVVQAAKWCREALDELGAGAKTAAGYGYLLSRDVTGEETP